MHLRNVGLMGKVIRSTQFAKRGGAGRFHFTGSLKNIQGFSEPPGIIQQSTQEAQGQLVIRKLARNFRQLVNGLRIRRYGLRRQKHLFGLAGPQAQIAIFRLRSRENLIRQIDAGRRVGQEIAIEFQPPGDVLIQTPLAIHLLVSLASNAMPKLGIIGELVEFLQHLPGTGSEKPSVAVCD